MKQETTTTTIKKIIDHEIKGLTFIENAVDCSYQDKLWKAINEGKWDTTLKRRTQQFGYKYNYLSKKVDEKIANLPSWSLDLCHLFLEQGWIQTLPNQLIINEYQPDQGIGRHIDSPEFGPQIFSLSLGVSCSMIFRRGDMKITRIIFPGMFLLMEDEARSLWSHEIPKVIGKPRISLTFRNVTVKEEK